MALHVHKIKQYTITKLFKFDIPNTNKGRNLRKTGLGSS